MERIELKRPYVRVHRGAEVSYGGSQMWLEKESSRTAACGLIACADVLAYLRGETEFTYSEYLAYVTGLRRRFPLIPYRGIDGLRLALGMTRCLREARPGLRARWCISGARFFERLERMLRADIPAIIAIGPNVPPFRHRQALPLYRRREDGTMIEACRARAHYVTVTGMDREWMRISSWGREYCISRRQYEAYMHTQSLSAVTNLLYIEKTP